MTIEVPQGLTLSINRIGQYIIRNLFHHMNHASAIGPEAFWVGQPCMRQDLVLPI